MQNNDPASNYICSQVFGHRNIADKVHEEDIISVLKFDHSGRHIAIGDNAGRIIIFYQQQLLSHSILSHNSLLTPFQYHSQFQSHNKQFDPFKSHQIHQGIKDLCWLNQQGSYLKMITANQNRIKVWKIYEKTEKKLVKSSGKLLNMPKIDSYQSSMVSHLQKTFPNLHQTPINSIKTTNNQEYLISSDQSQILLWSLQKPLKPFLLVDKTKNNKYIPNETKFRPSSPMNFICPQHITSNQIHPHSDSIFLYGTSKGKLRLCDLRFSSECETNGINFISQISHGKKDFFSEIISSISSIQFLSNQKHIMTRDLMTIKIWDVCKPDKPINIIPIESKLKPKLCDIFQNQSINDQFNSSVSNLGDTILTGNFNNTFHLINPTQSVTGITNNTMEVEAQHLIKNHTNYKYQLDFGKQTIKSNVYENQTPINKVDCVNKVLASDFHPFNHMIAAASLNCFFIYALP